MIRKMPLKIQRTQRGSRLISMFARIAADTGMARRAGILSAQIAVAGVQEFKTVP